MIEPASTAAERDGPRVIDDDAWSCAEADAEDADADAAANDAGRTRESGVEKRPGGER